MEKLTEMMQFRNELTQRYNDLNAAKEAYKFIMEGIPGDIDVPVAGNWIYDKSETSPAKIIPDGVYYIFSDGSYVIADEETCKRDNIIAVGVKNGMFHTAIALHDWEYDGKDEFSICNDDYKKIRSGAPYFEQEYKAIRDFDGLQHTKDMANNQILSDGLKSILERGMYIPACGELHLLAMFTDEVNNALKMAGGEMLLGSHWSSSEHSSNYCWYVNFNDGGTNTYGKLGSFSVRPAVAWAL